MDIQIAKGETVILLVTPLDTRGQGWLLTEDIYKVLFTVRETEDSDAILELEGVVEAVGETVDNSGKLAVLIHSEDTKSRPVGEYWYDVVMLKRGHWFDIDEYVGLYSKINFGRIKSGGWLDIEEGWVELTDDAVNFIQITPTGEYKVTTDGYEKDGEGKLVNYSLYRIITIGGEIVDVYPYGDWFKAGTHSGLEFVYEAGKVLSEDNILLDVPAGSVELRPDIDNFIEVDNAGVVSSNITRFTQGRYPLYTVTTGIDSILTVKKESNNFILDDRAKFTRGDSYIPSVKANVSIIWTPTKAEG